MKSNAGNRPRRPVVRSPQGPGQLATNIEVKHQYRFSSSSAAPIAISDTRLLAACGVDAVTATLGKGIWQTVKVNQIEIWTPPAAQGANATCSVLFPAAQQSQAREVTDTTVSVAKPAHVLVTPPRYSLCSFWQNGTGNTLFTLVAPPGSIIDVWVSLILGDGPLAAVISQVLVGATIGSVYYAPLDLNMVAGAVYLPIGLTTL
jgi:hypothetical protein